MFDDNETAETEALTDCESLSNENLDMKMNDFTNTIVMFDNYLQVNDGFSVQQEDIDNHLFIPTIKTLKRPDQFSIVLLLTRKI